MATNSPESIQEAIENIISASSAINQFGTAIRRSGGMATDSLRESAGFSEQELKKRKENLNKMQQATVQYANTVMSLSNQIQGAAGSFTALSGLVSVATKGLSGLAGAISSVVPIFGNIAKAGVEVAGTIAQELLKSFEKAYGNFEQLASSGVLEKFEDLTDTVDRTGMNFSDSTKILTKFSKELAAFGGSAVSGRQRFEDISIESRDMRENFQKLGISVSDFNDYQLTYLSQQQKWGLIGNKNTKDLKEGTEAYIKELDTLSKLTGLQKKDIQSIRDQAMSETRFAAALADLPKDVQDAANDLNVVLKSTGADSIAQGLRDMMSGSVGTEAARQFVMQTGGMGVEIVEKIRSGTLKATDGFNLIQQAAKQTIPNITQLAKHVGDASIYTKEYAQLRNMVNRGELTPQQAEKIIKEREKNLKATEGQNAELANAKQKLYNAAANLDKLMVSSEGATWAIEGMATAVDATISKIYDWVGKDLPADVKARQDLRKAMKEETEERKTLNSLIKESSQQVTPASPEEQTTTVQSDSRISRQQQKLKDKEREVAEAKKRVEVEFKKREAERRKDTEAASAGPSASGAKLTASDKRFEGLKIKSDESVAGGDVSQEVVDKMKQFVKMYPGTTITAFNDLYKDRKGKAHGQGKAVDFTIDPKPTKEEAIAITKVLKDLGFAKVVEGYHTQKHGTGDHFHAELMAKGGITRGISIAGEAGPEAVVPLPDGKTIPVEIKGQAFNGPGMLTDFEISNLSETIKNSMSQLKNSQEETNSNLEILIEQMKSNNENFRAIQDTLTSSRNIQGKLLTHSMS
jgi:hypothetical protein